MDRSVVHSKKMYPENVTIPHLNLHIVCTLCGGYLIDATTIIECLHTFCRSCLLSYLDVTEYCPVCDVKVHDIKPVMGIRRDEVLQTLVYKLVPGLLASEIQRRADFYSRNQSYESFEKSAVECNAGDIILDDETISVILQFKDMSESPIQDNGTNSQNCRFLLCPVKLPIRLVKKFIRAKFNIDAKYEIEVYHADEPLQNHYTLRDLAYIFSWKRNEPMKLFFSAFTTTVINNSVNIEEKSQHINKNCSSASLSSLYNNSNIPSIPTTHCINQCYSSSTLFPLSYPDVGSANSPESSENDSAENNDKTYTPSEPHKDDDTSIYRSKRPRGRPPGRRRGGGGFTRLLASRRVLDLYRSAENQAYRQYNHNRYSSSLRSSQITRRPRGRPRKYGNSSNNNSYSLTFSPRKRSSTRFGYHNRSTTGIKDEKKIKLDITENVKTDIKILDSKSIKQEPIENDKEYCHITNQSLNVGKLENSILTNSLKVENKSIKKLTLHNKKQTDKKSGKVVGDVKDNQMSGVLPATAGRVHWIYRKRKLPFPSIPVSFKLNKELILQNIRRKVCGNTSNTASPTSTSNEKSIKLHGQHLDSKSSQIIKAVSANTNLTPGVEMPFKRSSRCIVFDEDSSSSHGYPRPQDQSTKSEQTSENKQVCDSRLSSLEAGQEMPFKRSARCIMFDSSKSKKPQGLNEAPSTLTQSHNGIRNLATTFEKKSKVKPEKREKGSEKSTVCSNQASASQSKLNSKSAFTDFNLVKQNTSNTADKPVHIDALNVNVTTELKGYESVKNNTPNHKLLYLLKRCTEKSTGQGLNNFIAAQWDDDCLEEKVDTSLLKFQPLSVNLS